MGSVRVVVAVDRSGSLFWYSFVYENKLLANINYCIYNYIQSDSHLIHPSALFPLENIRLSRNK